MKNPLPVFVLGLFSSAALVYAGTGASTITLSATPAAVNCGAASFVNRAVVSVIPGGEGKVYVGQSSQNLRAAPASRRFCFPTLARTASNLNCPILRATIPSTFAIST